MKIDKWAQAAVVVTALALAGCGSKSSVDVTPLEKSFQSAEATVQSSAQKAIASVKSGDYTGALNELKALAGKAKLTPDQQQAIKDVMAQLEKAIADAAGKAAGDAQKAANDATKSLPK
jgi:hypothetical protein